MKTHNANEASLNSIFLLWLWVKTHKALSRLVYLSSCICRGPFCNEWSVIKLKILFAIAFWRDPVKTEHENTIKVGEENK